MDQSVRQAMAKWPNVPHCYGWLALDARGHWRMRDARAQSLNLPGERIAHAALCAFIARNYGHDERGRWFFQNGPQRVYVLLEAAPYIARCDGPHGLLLHTGAPLGRLDAAFLSEDGALILQRGELVAQLDDRDLAQMMDALELDGRAPGDDALLAWLAGAPGALTLRQEEVRLPVQRIGHGQAPARFGFDPAPAA